MLKTMNGIKGENKKVKRRMNGKKTAMRTCGRFKKAEEKKVVVLGLIVEINC